MLLNVKPLQQEAEGTDPEARDIVTGPGEIKTDILIELLG
jgi:hypothetical protein